MKQKIAFILAFAFAAAASADTIHLKNGETLSGKILRVSETNIEYDPDGEIPFDTVRRDDVVKMVYSNGKSVIFSEPEDSHSVQSGTVQTEPLCSEKAEQNETSTQKPVIAAKAPETKIKVIRNNDIDIYLYPSFLYGVCADPGFSRWVHNRTRQYLRDLQASDASYAGYSLEYRNGDSVEKHDVQSGSYLGIGFGFSGEYFSGANGLGVSAHFLYDFDGGEAYKKVIKDQSGQEQYEIKYSTFYNDCSATYFYRFELTTDNPDPGASKVYFRLGLGADMSRSYYKFKATLYDSDEHAPLYDDYAVKCVVKRYGWHLSGSFGVDLGIITANVGLVYTYMLGGHASITGDHPGLSKSQLKAVQTVSYQMGAGIRL